MATEINYTPLKIDEDLREYSITDKVHRHPAWRFYFPNGFGASVVKHEHSYGSDEDLFELAVITGTGDDWYLCYETPITDDVLGWLTNEDVMEKVREIKALPIEKGWEKEC